MRIQKNPDTMSSNSSNMPPTTISRRQDQRLTPQRGAEFIIQRDWGHLAQISLDQKNIVLAEIINISPSGVGCKVAYKFDIVSPIPIDITFAIQNSRSSIYSFEHVTIAGLIVRSTDLDGIFCEIGIKFMSVSALPQKKLERLIEQIT